MNKVLNRRNETQMALMLGYLRLRRLFRQRGMLGCGLTEGHRIFFQWVGRAVDQ